MAELAIRAGTEASQINKLEKGHRRLTEAWIERIAKALDCLPQEVIARVSREVPLYGRVVAGGKVEVVGGEGDGRPEMVAGPCWEWRGIHTLRVVGDGLAPVHFDGDLLYFQRERGFPETEWMEKECVVQVAEGEVLVRRVGPGARNGRVHLTFPNLGPIDDARLEWASPVLWIRRR